MFFLSTEKNESSNEGKINKIANALQTIKQNVPNRKWEQIVSVLNSDDAPPVEPKLGQQSSSTMKRKSSTIPSAVDDVPPVEPKSMRRNATITVPPADYNQRKWSPFGQDALGTYKLINM